MYLLTLYEYDFYINIKKTLSLNWLIERKI